MLSALKRRADEKDIPLNAIIVKMLSKSIALEDFAAMVPVLLLPGPMLARIFQHLDENAIEDIVNEYLNATQQLFMVAGIRYSVDEVVQNYFVSLAKYYNWYDLSSHRDHEEYRLVFKTSLGEEWLKFLTLYTRNVLSSLHVSHLSSWIGQDTIVFTFHK